jgi:two-component system, NarL family, invasion response regulator UvrY
MSTIRVAIADDHAITRASLREFIAEQPDMVVAGEAWDGHSAIALTRTRQPDVLLLDLLMPRKGGLDSLRAIRVNSPHTGILVLSSCSELEFGVDVLKRGANGFLSKGCEPAEIVKAVRVVATGKRYITPCIADLMAGALRPGALRHPHEYLTHREFQLLIHFARGQGSAEIADHLSLSPGTVSNYRTGLLAKLGLKNNCGLMHYAMVHGLLD